MKKYAIALLASILLFGCISKSALPLKNLNIGADFANISGKINSILNTSNLPILNNLNFQKNDEIYRKIGESAEYKGINVTVIEAKFSEDLREFSTFYPLDVNYGIAPKSYKFLVIYVRIVNNGNRTIYPTAHDFIVADSKGNIYTYSVLTHSFQDALDLKELKKGGKVEGRIVFVVPKNETKFKIAYSFNSLADFRSIFGFFRNKWAVWVINGGG